VIVKFGAQYGKQIAALSACINRDVMSAYDRFLPFTTQLQ
jgi:hypothetical protein